MLIENNYRSTIKDIPTVGLFIPVSPPNKKSCIGRSLHRAYNVPQRYPLHLHDTNARTPTLGMHEMNVTLLIPDT